MSINYDDDMLDGEYITELLVTARLEASPYTDQTEEILGGSGDPVAADVLRGTATGGDVNRMEDSETAFSLAGVKPGHKFLNRTQKWTALVKTIEETEDGWTAVLFADKPRSVEVGDDYEFFTGSVEIKGGESGGAYLVEFVATTSTGRILEDSVPIDILEN